MGANKLQSGGGSGLGLAFAKAIAEQHGGSLRAYSDGRDKGTTFRLELPLYAGGDVETNDSSSLLLSKKINEKSLSSKTHIREETLEPMSIMVVDDAPMNRKLLIRLLESNGHTCGEAENGQDLIATIKENMIQSDCIL